MRAVVLAYHDVGCTGLEALGRNGYDVAAVFTHSDDPGEHVWFESVAERAESLGVPVFAPADINEPHWIDRIRAIAPDILFSFFYRKLVQRPILEIPPAGCLNLHASLLPAYRGRAPINWVLARGERRTGVTLHHMTPRPDDGDIVGQRTIEISDADTAHTLMAKATCAAGALLDELLPLLRAGRAPRWSQDEARASYFGRRTPADGEIDWTRPSAAVRNLVRAVTHPYPGAFSHAGRRKLFLWEVTEEPPQADTEPGRVLGLDPLVIACGSGAVRVDVGRVEDGADVSGALLARDLGLAVGACLGRAPTGAAVRRP